MRYYSSKNVLNAARERVSFLFDEFENIVVPFSGGKDSTVVMNLALAEARKRNRLPLEVMFIDQEAEWQMVIDFVRRLQANPDIKVSWIQTPIKIENATSNYESYLVTWDGSSSAMREMEAGSIRNLSNQPVPFYDVFDLFYKKNNVQCSIGGLRAEESPARTAGITSKACYKGRTWGKVYASGAIVFYPIYDWTHADVWKYLNDINCDYCELYDQMYQMGVPQNKMRVSNLNHETALESLYLIQEIEPDTFNKLTKRLSGVNTANQLGKIGFQSVVSDLPEAFKSWTEYRDYLLEHLITDLSIRKKMGTKFAQMDVKYEGIGRVEKMHREQISTIIANDSWLTKIKNFECRNEVVTWYNWIYKAKPVPAHLLNQSPYVKYSTRKPTHRPA